MRVEHGIFRGYTFLVMTPVILSGGVKMRVEHGMLRCIPAVEIIDPPFPVPEGDAVRNS